MLHLKNVSVSYGDNHILRSISCDIQAGDFIVILGTNGAGKTTFFDAIAGKVRPTEGSIVLEGIDITGQDERERSSKITRLFQNPRLNCVGVCTVAQNLAIADYSRRRARLVSGMDGMPRGRAEMLVQELGMHSSIVDTRMNALSGGQRQLIAFVMATLKIPKILLLDEPTAALDPQAATNLLQYAAQFIQNHKITTLLITHDPHIALALGNKIWVLENGIIARRYDEEEKKYVHPDELIGQIDYTAIAQMNNMLAHKDLR